MANRTWKKRGVSSFLDCERLRNTKNKWKIPKFSHVPIFASELSNFRRILWTSGMWSKRKVNAVSNLFSNARTVYSFTRSLVSLGNYSSFIPTIYFSEGYTWIWIQEWSLLWPVSSSGWNNSYWTTRIFSHRMLKYGLRYFF